MDRITMNSNEILVRKWTVILIVPGQCFSKWIIGLILEPRPRSLSF